MVRKKEEDLRIRRTHKLLFNAIFELLETKTFDDISVVDICDKAMVHRATFYKHFNDKYDFIAYATQEKLTELYKKSLLLADLSDKKSLYKSILNTVITYVDENKRMFRIAAKSSNVTYYTLTNKIINDSLIKFIATTEQYGKKYDTPADVMATFLTGGFTTLLTWWVTSENNYTCDDIQHYLEEFIFMSDNIH